jgi:starch synthase (maltosyl-transferring)
MTFPETLSTIIIEHVEPEICGGRYPIKREIGDRLEVSADVFKEGHDVLAVVLRYRSAKDGAWRETPMQHIDNDRWLGRFDLTDNVRYQYTVAAYVEAFASWRQEVLKKRQGLRGKGALASELLEGHALLRSTVARATGEDKVRLAEALDRWKSNTDDHEAVFDLALSEELGELVRRHEEPLAWTVYDRELTVVVDRLTARFGAWYEMFPRSQGTQPGRPATFRDCEARLPAIRAMGFDVLYVPPIHPIGRTNRKGPNNSLQAGPNDPGSPYAIGNEWGGHDAIDPELGTLEDFDRFVRAVEQHGMELALDFAINCSPDHPYVKQHPEWFYHRPDGTIKYAENPPKRYEDIYPLNFYCSDWRNLWQEMKRIILFWVGHGVRIFRVDNPHTKPVAFWRWLIEEVQHAHPDVIFLSEAFTRPKMMRALAKAGFSQSYTYFTWRNFKEELATYVTELTQSEMKEYFRANFFTNTPDILPEILQHGGHPAFKFRLVLAATLSPSYGIYSGYEICENRAIAGTEEYQDSEKYEHKVWDWDRRGNIIDYIATINQIRRENPALQDYENVRFWECNNDHILYYGKATVDRSNAVLIAVNLNPFQVQECRLQVPLAEFGIGPNEVYQLHDLITDQRQLVKGPSLPIRLDPQAEPAVIFAVRRWSHREQKFDYFM